MIRALLPGRYGHFCDSQKNQETIKYKKWSDRSSRKRQSFFFAGPNQLASLDDNPAETVKLTKERVKAFSIFGRKIAPAKKF